MLHKNKQFIIHFWAYRPEVESRTQGSRPRPRTQKKFEAKDSLSEDRHSRGQGQECSRPRPRTKDTSESALKKKKDLHKNFSSDLHKKTFPINFSTTPQHFKGGVSSSQFRWFTIAKIEL